jgi:glass-like protein
MATVPQLILVPQKDNSLPATPADRVTSIKSEAEKLQKDLESLRNETQQYLEEKHRDNTEYLPTIRNAIAFLPASTRVEQIPLFGWKQQMEISSAPSFLSVFSMFKRICDFPDSSLLEHLVRLFGNQHIQTNLLAYTEKLRAFRSRTKVSDFTKACTLDSSLPLEFSILTIKIGREWHRSTLEDIEQLRQSMVQKALLTSYGIRLLQVEWEQGLLHWCVPSRALQSLVGSLDSEFLQENHVELLSINGTHLQSTGVSTLASFGSSLATSAESSPTSSSASQTKCGTTSLLPPSPPSATAGQTGTPLSLQDQLAMAGAQVVQFKPVPGVGTEAKQMSSPTLLSHSNTHSSQPTAVQIIHPQAVPSANGASGISMGRLAAVSVVQHPRNQQIQIIHPQVIQPGALPGAKHVIQHPQVIFQQGIPTSDIKPPVPVPERKPSLTQDGYMVMQGGPNNSLVLVPNYVMVNASGTRHKLASLSSPPSSSSFPGSSPATTILSPASLDRKPVGITSQGIATLLQPGQPASPLFTATQRGFSAMNHILPVTTSGSPIFTLAPGHGKAYENPIVSIPNPAVSVLNPAATSSHSLGTVSGMGMEGSILFDPATGRHTAQMKSLNHVCGICGNGYMWASSLKRHMHTHMGEGVEQPTELPHPPPELHEPLAKMSKLIECQICNQSLESPAAYTRHLRLHMKMRRRKDIARESEGRYSEDGSTEHQEPRENGGYGQREEEKTEDEGGEGEREGEMDSEGTGRAPKRKREDGCSSSSAGSEHSSDSTSETEEGIETAEPPQGSSPSNLPLKTEGSLQEPSTGTSQDSASLPNAMAISSSGIPFNQLLQYVGNKDSGEGVSETSTGMDPDSSQSVGRRFRCDECGRYLSSQAALSGHQQCMHNKQKPHVCHICNKGFFQSHSLTVHLRSHSGEKPYSCIVCNKSFSQRSSLNIHIRTHSGERPYQCPYCSRGFSDSSTLAKHRRTHTGERPYQCRECGASFSQSGNLWRHMKQVHPSAAVTT